MERLRLNIPQDPPPEYRRHYARLRSHCLQCALCGRHVTRTKHGDWAIPIHDPAKPLCGNGQLLAEIMLSTLPENGGDTSPPINGKAPG